MAAFSLGQIVATPGALAVMQAAGVSALELIARHARLEPGTLGAADQRANADAIKTGGRVFSSYAVGDETLWIITDVADDEGRRESTCILTPDEY